MAPLASDWEPIMAGVTVRDPAMPVVANVSADVENTVDQIRRNLVAQLASPVRWTASVQRLIADGFDTFVEVGPGRVLAGLVGQIDGKVRAVSVGDPAGIERVAETVAVA
jgi:[acyl-carrier-protein] S-malonyltransferase